MEVRDMHNSSNAAVALLLSIGTGIVPLRAYGRSSGNSLRAAKKLIATTKLLLTDANSTHERLHTIIGSDRSETYFRLNVENQYLASIKVDE